MKYLDEFRNKAAAKRLASRISSEVGEGEVTLMEVCGTHTMAVHRYGIKGLLPPNIRLLSGPGCPVCVTSNRYIDKAIAYSKQSDVILTTFGDMVKVPGSRSSLAREMSRGADVRIVYSTTDALKIARDNTERKVIFLGVGFETTVPTVATSILEADRMGMKNYFVLSAHKLIPPAMKALLDGGELKIDGFICPGHVSTITGTQVYEFIPRNYRVPCVVAGFEPVDIMQAIYTLVQQITRGIAEVANQYRRAVRKEGNPKAREVIYEVFEPSDSDWRGIGVIPQSGLMIRQRYRKYDAEANIDVEIEPSAENPRCICGAILRGVKEPLECTLFGSLCTPEHPKGACMVSSEGTCAAYYNYGRQMPKKPEG
ncbi:MAG TPA: hydrogenase formation protein HypD [Candidatus Latescibacteria bacterium]|nr:hydrogenase formation protein HypD [Candidatus Latescibacterota bacterium]